MEEFDSSLNYATIFERKINLYSNQDPLEALKEMEGVKDLELTVYNTIYGPAGDDGEGTTYTTTCVSLNQNYDSHAIAFEPIIDEETSQYVPLSCHALGYHAPGGTATGTT